MWIPSPTHRESDMEGLAYYSGNTAFINTSSFILQMVPSDESHLKKNSLLGKHFLVEKRWECKK